MRLSRNYIIEGFRLNKNTSIYDKEKIYEKALPLSFLLINKEKKLKEEYDINSFAYNQLKKTGNMDDEYGRMVCEAVLDLLDLFSMQGHSGFSAPYTLYYFNKLAKHEPITLIDNPMLYNEYEDVSEISCLPIGTMFQSNILYNMFSDDGGNSWYLLLDEIYLDETGARYSKCYKLSVTFPFDYDEILKGQEERKYANVKGLKEKVYLGKLNRLNEISLYDLRQTDSTSELTKKYKGARESGNKKANINTKFIQSELEGSDVIFKFLTEASKLTAVTDKETGKVSYVPYEEINPNHKYQEIIPGTDELKDNPSKTYEIWIKLLNVIGPDGWLKVFDPERETITPQMIKELVDNADVELFSNDPSYTFQGFSYNLTQLGASIFPENRQPKKWDKYHGDNLFTKHISQVVDQLPFFLNLMASSLTNLLRSNELLPKYKRKKK